MSVEDYFNLAKLPVLLSSNSLISRIQSIVDTLQQEDLKQEIFSIASSPDSRIDHTPAAFDSFRLCIHFTCKNYLGVIYLWIPAQ